MGRFLPEKLLVIKDFSSFLQLGFNTWVFRRMPLWVSRLYLGGLARAYFCAARRHRQAIVKVLTHFAESRQDLPSARRLWPRVRAGICDHYHEKLALGFRPYDVIRREALEKVEVAGRRHLDAALAQGRGAIVVTGHFGAVEYLPGTLAFRGLPVTVMVHCKSPELRRRLEDHATRAGTRLLDPKAQSTFFQAVDHLKQGRILLTQCDEISMWRPYSDRTVNFLGLNMGLDRSLDLLARKSGAPVVFGLIHRLGEGRYRLTLEPVTAGERAAGRELVSRACLRRLAENIYAQPAAWYEWKKLAPHLPPPLDAKTHEDSWLHRLPGSVALSDSGRA
jgi:lauroyl/myristoyl acyltransferase